MARSDRMRVVQNHQQDKADKAGAVVVESRSALEIQTERLAQLSAYRDDYWERYCKPQGASLNVSLLQDFRSFIDRLDQAIEQQRLVVARAESDCENKQEKWMHERSREKAIGSVVEKFCVQEQSEQDRRDQKQSDEFSQRSSFRNSERLG